MYRPIEVKTSDNISARNDASKIRKKEKIICMFVKYFLSATI